MIKKGRGTKSKKRKLLQPFKKNTQYRSSNTPFFYFCSMETLRLISTLTSNEEVSFELPPHDEKALKCLTNHVSKYLKENLDNLPVILDKKDIIKCKKDQTFLELLLIGSEIEFDFFVEYNKENQYSYSIYQIGKKYVAFLRYSYYFKYEARFFFVKPKTTKISVTQYMPVNPR